MNLTSMLSPGLRSPSQSLLARLQVTPAPLTSPITLSTQSTAESKLSRMVHWVTVWLTGPRVTSPVHCPAVSSSMVTHSSEPES